MSKNIRDSAQGERCTVRIPGVCNHNRETVVFAHLNGAGIAMKAPDIHGAYACSDCHAWLDGGYAKEATREQRDLYHLEAVIRTQCRLMDKGLIVIK